eukprot:scaffold99475_cov72-Phaeocystis_antarctica.AAC.3
MLAQPTPVPSVSVPTRHVAVKMVPTYPVAPMPTLMVAATLEVPLVTTTPSTVGARKTSADLTCCVALSANVAKMKTFATSPSALSRCCSCATAVNEDDAGTCATIAGAAVCHATPVTNSTAASLTVTLVCTESEGELETVSIVLPAVSPRRLDSASSATMLPSPMLTETSEVTSTSSMDVRLSPPKVANTVRSVLW